MKIKFGAMVVAGSGKLGGHVAARNKAGAYFRTKVTPVNPNTGYQAAARSRLSTLSQAWRGLTADQRAAWNGAVGDYSSTDIFGDLKNPSGFNLYQKLNNNLVNIGESALLLPPTPQDVKNFVSVSLAVVTGVPGATITFADAIAATEKVKLFATAPMSPGISFVKSEFRQIAILDSTDTSPYDATAAYIAKYGTVGSTGQKIFVKLVPVSVASGQDGIGIIADAISTVA